MKNDGFMIKTTLKTIFHRLFLLTLLVSAPAWADETGGGFLLTVPLTGPLGQLGLHARQGAELALKTWGGGFFLEVADEAVGLREDFNVSSVRLALGYFTASRFQTDAPLYLHLRKPVILPFLTNPEAVAAGPGLFFRLIPTFQEQGRFLALEILKMSKRPRSIVIVRGAGEDQTSLATALEETLAAPEQAQPGGRAGSAGAAKSTLKPLDSRVTVLTITLAEAQEPSNFTEFTKSGPDLIILALSRVEALSLAPALAESKWSKAAVWGGVILGFREVGAAFASLKLNLHLGLPVVNLADDRPKEVREFKQSYVAAFRAQPTWISALAYDSLNLAIKAASSAETPEGLLAFLYGQTHHALGLYDWSAGAMMPMEMMPVKIETLGFLP
ncbi:MAG: ABC transporter substrate-binding protein [Candidatus Adiutrix sp.]|jgi:ABC-type branched-subunit amino acid transport system substrate-binding protein|nr:ABC transporter substrate-binding protein [Candidatus Adiutrix sp.]